MNDKHRCRCGSLEIQRLREENAVLMAAVEHYADFTHWVNADLTLHTKDFIADEYNFERSGFVIAQAAIEQAKGILDNDN